MFVNLPVIMCTQVIYECNKKASHVERAFLDDPLKYNGGMELVGLLSEPPILELALLGERVGHVGGPCPDEAVDGVDQRVPHRQPQQRRVTGRHVVELVLENILAKFFQKDTWYKIGCGK